MTLEELSNKLYESKVLHDYKDGKIDYRKVHDFIVGLNESLTTPDSAKQIESDKIDEFGTCKCGNAVQIECDDCIDDRLGSALV